MEDKEVKEIYYPRIKQLLEDVVFRTENKEIAFQCMLVLGKEYTVKYTPKVYIVHLSYDSFFIDMLNPTGDRLTWLPKFRTVIEALENLHRQAYTKCTTISDVWHALDRIKTSEMEERLYKEEEIRAKFRRY